MDKKIFTVICILLVATWNAFSAPNICDNGCEKDPIKCPDPRTPYLCKRSWWPDKCVTEGFGFGECGIHPGGGYCIECDAGCFHYTELGGESCGLWAGKYDPNTMSETPYCCKKTSPWRGNIWVKEGYDFGCCGGLPPQWEFKEGAILVIDEIKNTDPSCAGKEYTVKWEVKRKGESVFKDYSSLCDEGDYTKHKLKLDLGESIEGLTCRSTEIPSFSSGPHTARVSWCSYIKEFEYGGELEEINTCSDCIKRGGVWCQDVHGLNSNCKKSCGDCFYNDKCYESTCPDPQLKNDIHLCDSPSDSKCDSDTDDDGLVYAKVEQYTVGFSGIQCEINWGDESEIESITLDDEIIGHLYTAPGRYTVTYKCENEEVDLESIASDTIEVTNIDPTITPPQISIILGDDKDGDDEVDDDGEVWAMLSNDREEKGSYYSCDIDWGEGKGFEAIDGKCNYSVHFYQKTGVYTVRYKCKDWDAHLTSTTSDTIEVTDVAPLRISITLGDDKDGDDEVDDDGEVWATLSNPYLERKLKYPYSDVLLSYPKFNCQIDWDDGYGFQGIVERFKYARHFYTTPGEYTIRYKCTLVDQKGITATTSDSIRVTNGLPSAYLSIVLGDDKGGDDEISYDGVVWGTLYNDFSKLGEGIIECYVNWGDGNEYKVHWRTKHRSHLYSNPDTYTVKYRCIHSPDFPMVGSTANMLSAFDTIEVKKSIPLVPISIKLGDERGGDDGTDDDGLVWAILDNGDDPGRWEFCEIDMGDGKYKEWDYNPFTNKYEFVTFIEIDPETRVIKTIYPSTGSYTARYKCTNKQIEGKSAYFQECSGGVCRLNYDPEKMKPFMSESEDTIDITYKNPTLKAEILKPESDDLATGCPATFTGRATGGYPPYRVKWFFNDYKVVAEAEIKNDGEEHILNLMPGSSDLPEAIGDITFKVIDQGDQKASDKKIDINFCCDPSECKDPCLTNSPKGPGVPFAFDKLKVQKYDSSDDTISVGTLGVEEAVVKALANGVNKHPEWNLNNPDKLNAEQRLQAIYEYIRDNMGYLCDFSGCSSCGDNCAECEGFALCSCDYVKEAGYSCNGEEGELFLSGEEVIKLTPSCCNPGTYKYHGDCDDYAHLYISMARTSGISEHCVSWVSYVWPLGGHAFNSARIGNKWHYVDVQAGNHFGWSWEQMMKEMPPSVCGAGAEHDAYNDYSYLDICEEMLNE